MEGAKRPISHDPGASVTPGTSRTVEQSRFLPRAQESSRRVWSRDASSGLQRSQQERGVKEGRKQKGAGIQGTRKCLHPQVFAETQK